jgi:hypothetical protein
MRSGEGGFVPIVHRGFLWTHRSEPLVTAIVSLVRSRAAG